jgi:hypothetical protein
MRFMRFIVSGVSGVSAFHFTKAFHAFRGCLSLTGGRVDGDGSRLGHADLDAIRGGKACGSVQDARQVKS